MVFVEAGGDASGSQRSYADVYHDMLACYRRSPSTSASSIIVLVAPDVDALCAARMLQELFRQDDVLHRIIPVSGMEALEQQRDELTKQPDLHTLILVNMGSILDLPSAEWFGNFHADLTVHVIDSFRPQNLASLFDSSPAGQRIVVWDDGNASGMKDEREAWEALMAHPEDSDDEGEDAEDDDCRGGDDESEQGDASGDESETSSGKRRRSTGDNDSPSGKRRRVGDEDRPPRLSTDLRHKYNARVEKHYTLGTWYGQAASGITYALATALERIDNDMLWYAILGLTFQFSTARISRETYENYHAIFSAEVARLNPIPTSTSSQSLHPDDSTIRPSEELRFTLFRHWTLYDAMFHSSYVANKLGIWRERGRKKLTGLLAKMGFSIPQTQQPYAHMDMDLKRELGAKLESIAPEYGLLELTYPSFTRCYGYRTQPLSAADMVEGIGALIEIAGGVKIEIEIEGARNGGEWFGGGRVWTARGSEIWKEDERENIPPGEAGPSRTSAKPANDKVTAEPVEASQKPLEWWIKNFWTAFDSLHDLGRVRDALALSMSLHRAITRQGTSIIDKHDIKTMHGHRVVVLTQGPDLPLFAHPGVLSRLALWLVEAMRDRVGDGKIGHTRRRGLPFVVACLDENASRYIVVGVTAAPEFGDVRKNQFGLAFLDAKARCNARTRHGSFDTSVLEINQDDLIIFLQTLCNESLAARF